MTIYNFGAGPAMLPYAVKQRIQQDAFDWQGSGMGVMELSHRGAMFDRVAASLEQRVRRLLKVPSHYHVLFLATGARSQFEAIPLNLCGGAPVAHYLISGYWSKLAASMASRYAQIICVNSVEKNNPTTTLDDPSQWTLVERAAYFHYVDNETIDGVEFAVPPSAPEQVLVADMSSNIFSKPIDVNQYGLIYAGAQKNMGIAGLTLVIIRDDLLYRQQAYLPLTWNYQHQALHSSRHQTPCTFAWYVADLVLEWLEEQGGLPRVTEKNAQKAAYLYDYLDSTDFYRANVPKAWRSRMNVVFSLANSQLDAQFLAQAQSAGLMYLKNHKDGPGMRASIYNAMPLEGVQTLVAFMQEFARRAG